MYSLKFNCVVGTLLLTGACGSSTSDSKANEGETAKVASKTAEKEQATPSTPETKPEGDSVKLQAAEKKEITDTADDATGKLPEDGIDVEAKKVGADISMESKESYCYLENVFEENGKTLITVDFIQVKSTTTDGEEGYEEINKNKKLRTFMLNSTTTFLPPNDLDVERLKRVLKTQTEHNGKNPDEEDFYQRFQITVKDGFVSKLLIDMAG